MTTITETKDTLDTIINEVAETALTFAEWSDADTNVTTAGDETSDDWTDHGRVLEHGPSGMYVALFLTDNYWDQDGDYVRSSGIRVCLSNDWNATDSRPTGKTNVTNSDPFSGDVGNHLEDSYANWDRNGYGYASGDGTHMLYLFEGSHSPGTLSTFEATYFASVTGEYINLAAWNTGDSDDGAAAAFSFEYTGSKFWDDGETPYLCWTASNSFENDYGGQRETAYAFQNFSGRGRQVASNPYSGDGFDSGEWGIVNPDSTDDTFFFKRPVAYHTASEHTPVTYAHEVISNNIEEGGSHGDTIDHDGMTYRIMRQSGAAQNTPICLGMRYE